MQVVLGIALIALAANGFEPFAKDNEESAPVSKAAAGPPRPNVDRFDEARAFALLREQVALGPRPAGSAASRRLAARLRARLPGGRFEAVPGGLRNVVGRLPGTRPATVIAAHYDTKDIPGFVGANDAAGGTAAVVEIARALRRARRPAGAPELRFVLFDGEETPRGSPPGAFLRHGVRGARAYLRRHRREVGRVVLLDFVADRDLSLPRESGSDPALWRRLRLAAAQVGVVRAFPNRTVAPVLDDHTPFARAGIPAIDLIDFEFPCWHRRCDDLRAVSSRSLDVSGEAVVQLVRTL